MQLRNDLKQWMEEYAARCREPFGGNSFTSLVTKKIPGTVQKICGDETRYKVAGSCGKGNWARVPWIAVYDTRITSSAQKGVYLVYLLNQETRELYLSMNQSATEVSREENQGRSTGLSGTGNRKNLAKLRKRTEGIRTRLNAELPWNTEIRTGQSSYDAGSIYFIRYTTKTLPDDEVLAEDLRRFLAAYQMYYDRVYSAKPVQSEPKQEQEQMTVNLEHELAGAQRPAKSELADIITFIASRGFTYPNGMIENLYLSLKSKPFVILAGISGTGKTRIAKLFAEAIGAAYKIVPVRPDWSDSSDLFGYTDLNGHFVHGAVFDFVYEAQCNPQRPYILCLDEMNLARVEYYLSDFLSVLETREMRNGNIRSAPLFTREKYGSDQISAEKYGELYFPENLYLIGTVNMDETTFPFSKKVLDRANIIEFSDVDLNPSLTETEQDAAPLSLPNSFLRSNYLILKQCAGEAEYVISICSEMQKLNDVLKKANLHVGYRVRDEIVFYMLNNREAEGLLTEDEAMDFEIMQKILPRIQGSSAAVKDVLCGLFKYCAADLTQFTGDRDSEKMEKARKQVQCCYPKSAEKLELMTRRVEEDGFTSYWL